MLGMGGCQHPASPGLPRKERAFGRNPLAGLPLPSDTLPLLDSSGSPVYALPTAAWRHLHERGDLIRLEFSRRQKLLAARLLPGITMALIHQALRVGLRDRLPVLPPTVIRVVGPGIVRYEHHYQRCMSYYSPRWMA